MQTLAHLNQIFKWKTYRPVNDTADILLVDEERTYELIEKTTDKATLLNAKDRLRKYQTRREVHFAILEIEHAIKRREAKKKLIKAVMGAVAVVAATVAIIVVVSI